MLDTRRGDVWEIDPRTSGLRRLTRISGFPTSIAGAGGAWIVDARGGTVTRLRSR